SSVSSSNVRSRSSSIALQIWFVVQFDHCSALVAVSRSKAREDGSLHLMSVSMTEASVAHATHTSTESRSNNQPSVSPSFFPFLEWLVLKRYRTIGPQLRDPAGTKGVGKSATPAHADGPRSGPAADDDARARHPDPTCQGCRPRTQTSLGERGLI